MRSVLVFLLVGCGRLGFEPSAEVIDAAVDLPVTTDVTVTTSTVDFDVARAAGSPASPVNITVTIEEGVLVGASAAEVPAFTTGALPAGSTVTLRVDGRIIGAGGAGGSGGNGGTGGTPRPCGRDGAAGGIAILLTVPTTIQNNGLIAGGGGGGGGISGCNENAGGGGGAGSRAGRGGAGASTLTMQQELAFCGQDNGVRGGMPGTVGSETDGGAGAAIGGGLSATSGNGGALGKPGEDSKACVGGVDGAGGAAGHAIKRVSGATTNIGDGTYATGVGPIRGPVGA